MQSFRKWCESFNPNLINRLRIIHRETTYRDRGQNFPAIYIDAYLDDKHIGDLFLVNDEDGWNSYGVNVLPDFQRNGIATALYNYAETLGIKLKPSSSQTDDGKAFWASRLRV